MLKRLTTSALALMAVLQAVSSRAEFSAELVQVPIKPAAIERVPALANATTWQLRVTSDSVIFDFELYTRVAGGTIYNTPPSLAGSDVGPANPLFFSVVPELEFDSYLSLYENSIGLSSPSSSDFRNVYDGPYGFTTTEMHHWGSTGNFRTGGLDHYAVAQLTIVPNENSSPSIEWIGRYYEATPDDEIIEHVVAFPNTLGSPFQGDMNLDYHVDAADLGVWTSAFGQSGALAPSKAIYDLDNDGDSDEFDVGLLRGNIVTTNATPGQGDLDGDHDVDDDDWKRLRHLNFGHKWNLADLTQDKAVDGSDFLQWQRSVGAGFTLPAPGSSSALAAVPEPHALVLAVIAGFATFRPLRRRLAAPF